MSTRVDDASAPTPQRDVTVVVIAYNDAERLPTAVGSVLGQTLDNLECVIVDDASTDGTGDVARQLAAQHPEKVRAMSLPENSGGCSRPRNVGIDASRAPWVMFLDSDDELERHAAKNLLLAAEATGADLVSGRCVRVNVARNHQRTPWFPQLYGEHLALDSVRDNPDLLFDTLCTNKLFRRDFLDRHDIRFPEGLHYEDLLFTTEAYCSATKIALIPNEVYRWMVAEGAEDTTSISRRRDELRNFRDRITIHEHIDAFLAEHGFDDLKVYKDRKFLLQDLKLYLGELRRRDADYQREWVRLAGGYLRGMSAQALSLAGPVPRAAAFVVREGDIDAALDIADLWVRGNLAGDLGVRDGRAYLASRHLDDPGGREALDVTSLHLHTAPFSRQNLLNDLVAVEVDGDRAVVTGEVNNLLGRIKAEDDVRLTLLVRSRDGRVRRRVGTTEVTVTPTRLRWTTTLEPARELSRLEPSVLFWDFWTQIDLHGETNLARLTTVPGRVALTGMPTSVPRPWGHEHLKLAVSPNWDVYGVVSHSGRVRRLAHRASRRAKRSGVYRDLKRVAGAPNGRVVKGLAYRTVLRRLPIRADTVVFESMLGRSYSDSPKYVYEELRRGGPPRRAVWSHDGDAAGFPSDAVLVRRDSWRYYYELARAGTWVDNQGFPAIARPRDRTTYLQTWHGSPYKLMGYDQPELELGPERDRHRFAALVSRWTHFCVQSEFAEHAFDEAFRHRAVNLRTGYPRNDPLLNANDPAAVKELRARLELPDDRRVVLYAPTFRDYRRTMRARYALPFNLARLSADVGDEWFMLMRPHYLDALQIAPRYANFVRDVSGHHDVTELLLVADALVTDYSSLMFDYALLRRPMLFYAYDLDLYTLSRGSYFDLEAKAPGPVATTEDELVDWLRDPAPSHRGLAERYERFIEEFCTFEQGAAARDTVRQVFGTAP